MQVKKWPENEARFKELLLNVCQKCANDRKFGATKLNKILYFADFLAYAELGEPITGMEYQKLPNGPAPRSLKPIREQMVKDRELAVQCVRLVSGRVQARPVNLRPARLGMFTPEQISLVDGVIEALRDSTAEEVSELSHRMVGWKVVDTNETIPYETIFVSDEPLTEADIQRAQELARQIS
jgi:Protein of unknown function (DUF4065)